MPSNWRPDPLRPSTRPRHRAPGAEARDTRATAKGKVRAGSSSTLRVLIDETVGELVLKPQIAAFLLAHPSLAIEFRQHSWACGGTSEDVDLILQYAPASSTPVGVARLGGQKLLTCASSRYLRERGLPQHPLDLSRHRYDGIVVSENSTAPSAWNFVDGAKKLNVEVKRRAVTPSFSMALALALGGAGVAQIPECWGIGYVRSGRLVRLLPDSEESLHLCAIQPRHGHNPHVAALLRFARALVEMRAPTRPW
jgi:DNA-binding transcriptional LysR family regulator